MKKNISKLKLIISRSLVYLSAFGLLSHPMIAFSGQKEAEAKEILTEANKSVIDGWSKVLTEVDKNFRSFKITYLKEFEKNIHEIDFQKIPEIFSISAIRNFDEPLFKRQLNFIEGATQGVLNQIKQNKKLAVQLFNLRAKIKMDLVHIKLWPLEKFEDRIADIFLKLESAIDNLKTIKRIKMGFKLRSSKILNRDFFANDSVESHYTILDSGASGQILSSVNLDPDRAEGENVPKSYLVRFKFKQDMANDDSKENEFTEELWVDIDPELKSNEFYEIKTSGGIQTLTVKNEQTGIAYNSSPTDEIDSTIERLFIDSSRVDLFNPETGEKSSQLESPSILRKVSSVNSQNSNFRSKSKISLSDRKLWSPNCYNFIDKDGKYGPWAKAIQNSFKGKEKLISDAANWLIGDLSNEIGDTEKHIKLNKRFKEYSLEQKIDFMIYYAAAVAMTESSCRANQAAKGPNGTAIGLWQLHLGKTQNYAGGVCGKIKEIDGAQNVICGLKMLNFYVKTEKNPEHKLFWEKNYWETMHIDRPAGKRTYNLIKKYEK